MTTSRIPAELRQAWDSTPAAADDETCARGEDKAKGKATRRRTGDRFATLNAFVDFTLRDLTRNELAVWLLLWRDTKTGTARTGQADLARRAGISDRTVRRAIESLRRRGLLKVTYRGGIGRGASVYHVRPLPPDRLRTDL